MSGLHSADSGSESQSGSRAPERVHAEDALLEIMKGVGCQVLYLPKGPIQLVDIACSDCLVPFLLPHVGSPTPDRPPSAAQLGAEVVWHLREAAGLVKWHLGGAVECLSVEIEAGFHMGAATKALEGAYQSCSPGCGTKHRPRKRCRSPPQTPSAAKPLKPQRRGPAPYVSGRKHSVNSYGWPSVTCEVSHSTREVGWSTSWMFCAFWVSAFCSKNRS